MADPTALDGKTRVLNTYTDIGAYEFPETAYCRLFTMPLINFTPEYSFPVRLVSNLSFSFANIGGTEPVPIEIIGSAYIPDPLFSPLFLFIFGIITRCCVHRFQLHIICLQHIFV